MKRKHALSLACIFVLLAVLATGCGGSGSYAKTDSAPAESYYNGYTGSGINYETDEAYSDTASGVEDVSAVAANPDAKLIYTVDLTVETLDYEQSLTTIDSLVAEYGGYVEYAQVDNNRINSTRLRSAYYTLRVPAAQLGAFLDSCGAVGNVASSTRSTENRTTEYADLNARLNTLRLEEASLQELLEKAEDLDTIVSLHSYLSDVRYSIERVEASMRGIDSLACFSTIHLSLSEVKFATETVTPASTFGERLKARSAETWRNFSESLEDFGVFLFGELPSILVTLILYLLPVAIIVVVIILLVRRGRRKRLLRGEHRKQYPAQNPYVPQNPYAPMAQQPEQPAEQDPDQPTTK